MVIAPVDLVAALPRFGRVVTDTESSTAGSASSSLRESVVLPAPEGDDSTSISPRRGPASLR
jgi:hypothetical protein